MTRQEFLFFLSSFFSKLSMRGNFSLQGFEKREDMILECSNAPHCPSKNCLDCPPRRPADPASWIDESTAVPTLRHAISVTNPEQLL